MRVLSTGEANTEPGHKYLTCRATVRGVSGPETGEQRGEVSVFQTSADFGTPQSLTCPTLSNKREKGE
jgi:hypothetical protein